MTYKKASFLIILFVLLFILAPAVLIYVVDPFQVYHKSLFKKAGYSTNELFQRAGWINTLLADPAENYQAIMIGSSTMSNYTTTMVNQHLPWGNTMNLAIRGSSPLVQAVVAKHALQKNPAIKHILWDMHIQYCDVADEDNFQPPLPTFPHKLYNNTPIDDGEYFFNASNIESSINFIRGNFTGFDAGIEDNGPFYEEQVAQGLYKSYGSYENRKEKLLPTFIDGVRELSIEKINTFEYPSIDQNLLQVLLPYCNTEKDINVIFSPLSRYYYSSTWIDGVYRNIGMRRYVVERTTQCKNIKIYAFDNLDWITTDLYNYADSIHHSIKINHYILESIKNNENILTKDNIREYETTFIANLNKYKMEFVRDMENDKPR